MFFYTGNRGPIETFMNNSGFIFTLAKEFRALVVFAEHVSQEELLLVVGDCQHNFEHNI